MMDLINYLGCAGIKCINRAFGYRIIHLYSGGQGTRIGQLGNGAQHEYIEKGAVISNRSPPCFHISNIIALYDYLRCL